MYMYLILPQRNSEIIFIVIVLLHTFIIISSICKYMYRYIMSRLDKKTGLDAYIIHVHSNWNIYVSISNSTSVRF